MVECLFTNYVVVGSSPAAAIFMHKVYNDTAPAKFFELFKKFLIHIQEGFQNCATRYLKQILLNANTEFQAEEC